MSETSVLSRVRTLLSDHGTGLTALLTVGVFLGLVAYADGEALVAALGRVRLETVAAVLGLTTVGYGVRFLKWHLYLQQLGIEVSLRASLVTFFSGLMMVVTPGKAGELWKAWFLNDLKDVPISQTASVVGAERLTDLIGLSAMAATGLLLFRRSSVVLVGLVGVIAGGIVLLQWRSLCLRLVGRVEELPVVGGYADGFAEFYESTYALFQLGPLTVATILSVAAWTLEGVALWIVLAALTGEASLIVGIFVFGLGSVIGAVSFLPGGLGAAEASMVGLLVTFGYGISIATAATIVMRLGTLWYAVGVGTAAYLGFKFHSNS